MWFLLPFIAVVLLYASKLANKRGLGGTTGVIEVVARQRMGRASSVSVLRVAGRVLVVGSTEEQVTLLRLFAEMEPDERGVSASIGRENASFGLPEASVVISGYGSPSGELARVGVLGPTRMDYSNNMAAVRAVARYLTRLLGED